MSRIIRDVVEEKLAEVRGRLVGAEADVIRTHSTLEIVRKTRARLREQLAELEEARGQLTQGRNAP